MKTMLCCDKMFLTHCWLVNPQLMETGQTSLADIQTCVTLELVFVCLSVSIIRTFHYVGFEMVKPGSPMVPARPDLAFMVYSLDSSSSDEEWPPHCLWTPPPSNLHHWPTGVFSSAYLTSDAINLSFDTLVTEVFQAGSNQGIMGQ